MADFDVANTFLNGATLIAALAAGYLSYKSIQVQRSQRLAEFRKEWIENLRAHLAEFRASVYRRKSVRRLYDNQKKQGADKEELRRLVAQFAELTQNMALHHAYIKLSLNEGEPEHKALLDRMDFLLEDSDKEASIPPGKLTELARTVLKKEWERLKSEL